MPSAPAPAAADRLPPSGPAVPTKADGRIRGPAGRPRPQGPVAELRTRSHGDLFRPRMPCGLRSIGLRRFWTGYFAARAAPLGEVGPSGRQRPLLQLQ